MNNALPFWLILYDVWKILKKAYGRFQNFNVNVFTRLLCYEQGVTQDHLLSGV